MRANIPRAFLPLLVVSLLTSASKNADASPLPGDVTTSFMNVDYTVGGGVGTMTASGYPDGFFSGTLPILLIDTSTSSFNLSMTVNTTSNTVTTGGLTIAGNVMGMSSLDGTLLTGTPTSVSFPGSGNLDIFFNVTGGTLQAPYYTSNLGEIEFHAGTSFATTDLSQGFDETDYGGDSDTHPLFSTPEPSSLVLLVSALGFTTLGWPLRRWTRRVHLRHDPA
jgi:hypothetical protein